MDGFMRNFGFLLIAPQVLGSFPSAPHIKQLTTHKLHFCSVPCGSQTPERGSFSTCEGPACLPLFPGIYPKPKASNGVYRSIALGTRGSLRDWTPGRGVYEGVEFHPLPIPPRGGPFTPDLFGSWTPAYVHETPGIRLVGVILFVSSTNVNTNHANFGPQYRRDAALLLPLLYGQKDVSPRILSKCP